VKRGRRRRQREAKLDYSTCRSVKACNCHDSVINNYQHAAMSELDSCPHICTKLNIDMRDKGCHQWCVRTTVTGSENTHTHIIDFSFLVIEKLECKN
jgi:hypothetical protein